MAVAALAPMLPSAGSPGDAAIREAEIAATVTFLSSPELEGRAAAERGGAVASAFIASRLEAAGWLPAGDEGASGRTYFQSVPAVAARWDPRASSLRVAREGGEILLDGSGFRIAPDRGDTVEVSGDLVFAGFGIKAPELRHDDYRGIDVRGKVVLVLSGEPGELDAGSPWNGTRPTRHLPVSSKRALAASSGALALIVAPNPSGRARTSADSSVAWLGLASEKPAIPLVYLEADAVSRILDGSGLDLAAAVRRIEKGASASRDLGGRRVSLRLAYTDRKEVALRNVVARLGCGDGFAGEVVLVGAHWDHLGTSEGTLYPGADDNASGVAALLALAAALEAERPLGAREVVLAAWTGEERGQLGARAFLERPVVPLARLAAAVNLDMLGRSNMDREEYKDALQVIYSAGAPVLREMARRANDGVGFDLRFYAALRFRPVSDHHPFSEAGVPIVYPFSGYHADYHSPSDTSDKVSPARIARAARYVARLVRLLAAHDAPIRIDPSIHEAPPADPFETPYGG